MSKPSSISVKTSVFLVDDHPLVRDWLSKLIDQEEDLVVCGSADNADDAIRAIERAKPGLIIVDISIRGKSGLELIRFLTDQNPEQRILVLSMHEETVYAARAFKAGARGYVSKRESPEKIVQALQRILAGGVYVNDALAESLASGLSRRKGDVVDSDVSLLSDRELEVFRQLAVGKATAEIAYELSISLKTVQSYCARIKEKLNLQNATELLQAATRWGDAQKHG